MSDQKQTDNRAWDRLFEFIDNREDDLTDAEIHDDLNRFGIDMTEANEALLKMVADHRTTQSARVNESERTVQREWAKNFPVKAMKKLQFSLPTGLADADALLEFFDVASPNAWQSNWQSAAVSYRQTTRFKTNEQAISAWVREVEIIASGIDLAEFDEFKLRAAIEELRKLTRLPADQILDPIQTICATCGVAVVLVPTLPQTCISGCARWLSDNHALIGLTLRYKTDDQLWFTFFHEVGHLLLHRHVRSFVVDNAATDLSDGCIDPEMEQYELEANSFAANTLIPPAELEIFKQRQVFTNESIHEFADRIGVGPGIVVGRLQHDGLLKHFQGRALKQTLNWNFVDEV